MNDVRKSIGWADYTWNPITGCKRGCSYCYARRVHRRFYGNRKPFWEITFHPERLRDPGLTTKKSRTIFVGSMSDPEYWKLDHFKAILSVCGEFTQHTFMFLSKSPGAYRGIAFPANTMQGLTMTAIDHPAKARMVDEFLERNPRPFLSIEPLLGTVNYGFLGLDLCIVGAMSGPGAIKPKQEWIDSVKDNTDPDILYWKSNIRQYLFHSTKGHNGNTRE